MAGKLKSKATGNIGSKNGSKKGRKYGGKPVKFNPKTFETAKAEVFGMGNEHKVGE